MKKALIYSLFLLGLLSHTIGQSLDSTKSTNDLSFLAGEWIMKMTYSPESSEPRILEGTMCCDWVMDSTYIKCEYALARPGKKHALNDVYFNYNTISEKYESMWMSSTWPVKVLLAGDLINQNDTITLTTFAEFPIGDGLNEHVRDVLTIPFGEDSYKRKTFIKTSEETDWKYHSLEEAERNTVEELANKDQISGKTWQALGPDLTNLIRKNSEFSLVDSLSQQFQRDEKVLRSFLKYVLSYTSNDIASWKVIFRYPHYNQIAVEDDFRKLVSNGLTKKNDLGESFSTTDLGSDVLAAYWNLRNQQAASFNNLTSASIEALHDVISKVVEGAKKLGGDYQNESIKTRIASRPPDFERLPKIAQVSELLKEYTAFINDVSHYKYDNFISESADVRWNKLQLSPLAKELMSATRNDRVYTLDRCYDQSNWRQGVAGCDSAVEELVKAGLIVKEENSVKQTLLGAELSQAAEAFADLRRYQAWNDVALQEYMNFVREINLILESE